MARMVKKTLYLDGDALDRMEAALDAFPGQPSLSAFITDMLRQSVPMIEEMGAAARVSGIRGMAVMLQNTGQAVGKLEAEVTEVLADPDPRFDLTTDEMHKLLPPKKRPKSRKASPSG